MPALRPGTALCVAPQSDITKPLKPQSFRRMSVMSGTLSAAHVPLTLLYAHITEPTPARTAASYAGSSISRPVCSSTSALTDIRAFSWLLKA